MIDDRGSQEISLGDMVRVFPKVQPISFHMPWHTFQIQFTHKYSHMNGYSFRQLERSSDPARRSN